MPENDEGWEYQFIPKVTDGLNVSVRAEDIENTEVLISSNIRYEKNQALVDYGYKKFGQVTRGNSKATFQFFKTDGTSVLTMITNDTFYIWRVSKATWVQISDGTSTTLSAGEPTSETAIAVVSDTGFSDGDFIGIELDDGTQHQTTVNGAPAANVITITTGLASAAAAGKVLLKAKDLTGSDDVPVSIDVMSSQDWMIFTNGIDTPQKFDGATVEDVPNLPGSTFTAFAVATFREHLIFLRTVEDGTAHPQRERHSDTGDPSEWVTGNAGFTDLTETEDFIVTAVKLGPFLIIYKERSIVRVEFVGLSTELFQFPQVITGEGALSIDSVVDLGDEHIMFGNANIYSYKGGYNLEPIGDNIFHKVFSTKGNLNPSESNTVIGFYVEELDEIWYIYASGTDTVPKTMLRYLIQDRAFSERAFTTGITGYGLYVLEAVLDWADLIGDWDAQTWEWGSKTTLANAPTTQLCLGTQVVEYDYIETTDDGVAINFIIETGDFYLPQYFVTVDYVEMALKGTCEVQFSIDEGQTYVSLGTLGPGTNFERFRVFKQFVARKVRFRFIGTGPDFGMEWYGFNFRIESEW